MPAAGVSSAGSATLASTASSVPDRRIPVVGLSLKVVSGTGGSKLVLESSNNMSKPAPRLISKHTPPPPEPGAPTGSQADRLRINPDTWVLSTNTPPRNHEESMSITAARPEADEPLVVAADEHGIRRVADELGCDRRLVAGWWSEFVRQQLHQLHEPDHRPEAEPVVAEPIPLRPVAQPAPPERGSLRQQTAALLAAKEEARQGPGPDGDRPPARPGEADGA